MWIIIEYVTINVMLRHATNPAVAFEFELFRTVVVAITIIQEEKYSEFIRPLRHTNRLFRIINYLNIGFNIGLFYERFPCVKKQQLYLKCSCKGIT